MTDVKVATVVPDLIKQYEDIDVGLKMNSYTVNELQPGATYVFQLCLRKGGYVIGISSAELTTKDRGFEVELGIETDYVSLCAVAVVLTGENKMAASVCVVIKFQDGLATSPGV